MIIGCKKEVSKNAIAQPAIPPQAPEDPLRCCACHHTRGATQRTRYAQTPLQLIPPQLRASGELSQNINQSVYAPQLPMKPRTRATVLSRRHSSRRKTQAKEPNDFHFDDSDGSSAGGFEDTFGYFLLQSAKNYSHHHGKAVRRNAFEY